MRTYNKGPPGLERKKELSGQCIFKPTPDFVTHVASHSVRDVEHQLPDRFVFPKNRMVQDLSSSDFVIILRFLDFASDLGLSLSRS